MAKTPVKESTLEVFAKLLDKRYETFVPTKKGKVKGPESILIDESWDKIHDASEKGLPYKEIAELLSIASGLEIKASKLATQYRAIGVARGILKTPTPRAKKGEKAEEAKTA
jgi:hypothetical protein